MKEIWKDIEGYDGYKISNYGRVHTYRYGRDKIKKTVYDKYGYPYTVLFNKDGGKRFLVHRLVAQAFIPNPNNKPQVNHIDGNPNNSYYNNLEWCTAKENIKHAIDIGLIKRKLSQKDIDDIRLLGNNVDIRVADIAKRYSVSKNMVDRIIKGTLYPNGYSDHIQRERGYLNSGDNCSYAKVSESEVSEIRSLYKERKHTQQQLADKYNVSQTTISEIVNNKKRKLNALI